MKFTKNLLLTLPFLFIFNSTQALESSNIICIQKIQPAVNTNGECKVFSTPCDVPSDWKAIPSCDLVESKKINISLEEKMRKKLRTLRRKSKATKPTKRKIYRYGRKVGSGIRRTRAFINPSQKRISKKLRTSTQKDPSLLGLSKRKQYASSYKKLEDVPKIKKSIKRYSRPKFRSRTDRVRTGLLKSTKKWETEKKDHFREKQYGRNPYNIKSKYINDQKKLRDKTNKKIDVYKRIHSGFKTFRGERKLGSLDGEISE